MSSIVTSEASRAILPSVLNNMQAVGATWVISSALFTTYSTTKFLKYTAPSNVELQKSQKSSLSRATQLTLYRFFGSLLLGLFAHPNLKVVDRINETLHLLPRFSIPAIFLFVANYFNSVALKRLGISLTYTSKCAIPLITLVLTVILDGRESLPSTPALFSLLPIAIGIAVASWDHPTFETKGFLAAFVSCSAQSVLNVTSKRAINNLGISGAVAQRAMVTVGLAIASVVSILQLASQSQSKTELAMERPPTWLTAAAAIAYHVEYVLSFTFVKLVAPITYSTCDAIRRLSIIISGHFMFGGPPFTVLNILGIGLALSGAGAYSILNQR